MNNQVSSHKSDASQMPFPAASPKTNNRNDTIHQVFKTIVI